MRSARWGAYLDRRITVNVLDRPGAPAHGFVLCRFADLPDLAGREFSFGQPPIAFEMFVVRKGAAVFAYVNDCPHTHAPLNWLPNQFLDPSRTHLQCSMHGARFRIEDGFCILGPCKSDSLAAVPTALCNGEVVIA